jgi:DNA-binding IclR family transcriptional regulator
MSNGVAEGETDIGGGNGSVQSVDRALTILETLARQGEAGVTELARDLGVHKSTAFRLVATLESHGLVEQAEDRGKYRLGVGLLRLAGATTARLDVVQEARPVCRKLAADTGETVNIAVLADRAALYLDQIAGSSALQPHNWVGQHIPLHATANGKVLLSGLDSAALEELLGSLPAYTDMTITKKGQLRAEVDKVRGQGYAVAVDELEVGLTAAAAPIRNAHGDVIASMSVSGPTFRLGDAAVSRATELLCAAATEVSHRLGWGHR